MALVVETGTGRADAESFCSVAFATTYHANFGNAAWAALADDTTREQYLRRATAYMEQAYRERWAGYLINTTQALGWPRYEVPIKGYYGVGLSSQDSGLGAYWPADSIPSIVQNACAELALRAIAGALTVDVGAQVKQKVVGPISVTYADGARQTTEYKAVDDMLNVFFSSGGMNMRVVRA